MEYKFPCVISRTTNYTSEGNYIVPTRGWMFNQFPNTFEWYYDVDKTCNFNVEIM